MSYTPTFTKPYPDGWENLPEQTTPITAEVLDTYDAAIEAIEAQLKATTEMFNDSPPMVKMGNTDKTINSYNSAVFGTLNAIDGSNNIASGHDNISSDTHNSAISGESNKVSGIDHLIAGYKNEVSGSCNSVSGSENVVSGNYNSVCGSKNTNTNSGGGTSVRGVGNKNVDSDYYPHDVCGQYNDSTETLTGGILFEVGNGTNDSNRSNALLIDTYGNMRIAGDFIFGEEKTKLSTAIKSAIFDEHGWAQSYLNSASNTDYSLGQTLRIKKTGQSDLWISAVNTTPVSYSFSGDLEKDIKDAGGALQIGYYSVSLVQSGNQPNLSGYVTETELEAKGYLTEIPVATNNSVGAVKPDGTSITVDEDGTLHSAGSGGVTDYSLLTSKPKINGVELSGNVSFENLGIEIMTYESTLEVLNSTEVE